MIFKTKHQKELESEIRRCEDALLNNGMATKLFASRKLLEFRQVLETDMGGLEGYLDRPDEEKLTYMRMYGPIMEKAKVEENEAEFFAAYLFMLFLNGAGSGYRRTVDKAITAMRKVNSVVG
ncbi:hypothetical protein [Vreelandella arcis]|uniref:Uncharacterized protein n=1 Tax=Vreelandella arcis TaxID=416873 RepID=A0A1H0JEL8_9GAMM|nr:hypothetical protein [Halomonas arcis]SDO41973.1 hypothetical protein SAMN04487951_12617 [Halomonas arcis]